MNRLQSTDPLFSAPSIAHRYLLNINALRIATETLQKAEYQQTLPAY